MTINRWQQKPKGPRQHPLNAPMQQLQLLLYNEVDKSSSKDVALVYNILIYKLHIYTYIHIKTAEMQSQMHSS